MAESDETKALKEEPQETAKEVPNEDASKPTTTTTLTAETPAPEKKDVTMTPAKEEEEKDTTTETAAASDSVENKTTKDSETTAAPPTASVPEPSAPKEESKAETPANGGDKDAEDKSAPPPEATTDAAAAATTTTAIPPSPPRRKTTKKPDVIPTGPIITEINDMDVLSGRGAAVNNHPGNKKFRALCFVRKAHFDMGNHAAKRQLATEIVEILQSGKDHPPSRFLKKRPAKASSDPPAATAAAPSSNDTAATEGPPAADAAVKSDPDKTTTTTTTKETTADTITETAAAKTEEASGEKPPAPAERSPPKQPATYYAMTKEQAILKAQQVMRDYKRPDRLELKMLQQQASSYVPPGATGPTVKPPRARSAPSTPLEGVVDFLSAPNPEKDELFQANPFGVHAHDVLSGRGAYVNGHVGNARLRALALERKPRFDAGNYTEKRTLASEIVMAIKALNPPGRFLKRASKGLLEIYNAQQEEKAQQDATTTATATDKETKEEESKADDTKDATDSNKPNESSLSAAKPTDETKTEAPSDVATEGAAVLLQAAATAQPPPLVRLIDGLWEELTDDKAIHKACQVMRDISRPDRKYRETRREERLQKKNSKRRKLLEGVAALGGESSSAGKGDANPPKKEESASITKEGDEGLTAEGKAAVQVVDNSLLDGSGGSNTASAPSSKPALATEGTKVEVSTTTADTANVDSVEI